MGDLNSSDDSATGNAVEIPSRDKNTALTLLLEFAVQKGSLNEMLDMVRLLLTIWTLGRERQDNRTGKFFSKVKLPLVISTTFEFSRQNLDTKLLKNGTFQSILHLK